MPGRPVGWLEVRADPRVQGSSVVNTWPPHDHLRRTVFRVCVGSGGVLVPVSSFPPSLAGW